MSLPKELGYRMPAEWEPHEGTWLSWPKDPDTFPPGILAPVETIYAQMIAGLTDEKVHLLVDNRDCERKVIRLLNDKGIRRNHVVFHAIPTVDVWTRDYGPIFIKKGERPSSMAATKWVFNAWGDKYDELKPDNVAGEKITTHVGCPVFKSEIVLEGGSIDVNGRGTCLTTEQCLLNQNRNPQLHRGQIEIYLKAYFGLEHIIWLKEGIVGDDTDGHIDDIVRFVNPRTVVCALERNSSDENYAALKTNLEILQKAVDQNGQKLDVIPLPMPRPLHYEERRLPASYANFYIANGVVLIPVFQDANDDKAIVILEKLFPDRKVIGIYCEPLVVGFGGLHCVTQQQPK